MKTRALKLMKQAWGLGFATVLAGAACSDQDDKGAGTGTAPPNLPKVETVRQPLQQSFAAGSFIIPMDTTYQDNGMLKAYGLVYKLLANNVPVRWAIKTGKATQGIDFTASARNFQTNATISNAGYRGGPFVINSANRAAADPIIRAWHSAGNVTTVHDATQAFTAEVRRTLTSAPRVGVFADGHEVIASRYLNAAGIRDSAGQPWPTTFDSTRAYAAYPDMIDTNELAGVVTSGSPDGALLRADGTPIFCHVSSMHYSLPTNGEVVHEVRHWLESSPHTHAFMSCEATSDFENNAAWGKFLTTGGARDDGHDVPEPLKNLVPDHPLSQFDGDLEATEGAVQSLGLNAGSAWRSGVQVLLAKTSMTSGNPTDRVMWVTGKLDGNATNGRVSYQTGHEFLWDIPVSQNEMANGIRLYLNSLFESTCAVAEAEPQVVVTVLGPASTNAATLAYDVTVENRGGGIAEATAVAFSLPSGMTFVSATGGGYHANGFVSWSVGNLRAGQNAARQVTVAVTANGVYAAQMVGLYKVGVTQKSAWSNVVSTTRAGVAPETMLTGYPQGGTTSTSATFTFTSNVASATFECKLDGAANWSACASGITYTNLAVGWHTFEARAKDAQGNVDATPVDHAWLIAAPAPAPDTTLTQTPPVSSSSNSNAATATFAFSSTTSGVTFECNLDWLGWMACTSPKTYTGLAEGSHVFYVRAKTAAGVVDPTPAEFSWAVDLTPPNTTINNTPGSVTNSTSATFTFSSSESGVTFECHLDGAAFAACTSPKTYGGLLDGNHTFYVRAKDAAGNVDASPAWHPWVIDTVPPDTGFAQAPPGYTTSSTETFRFFSTENGVVYECQLDSAPVFTSCTNPITLTGLANGSHTFRVRSRDPAGNVDPAPAVLTWVVSVASPETSLAATPPATTTSTSATFNFVSGTSAPYFECRLDGAAFGACTSPKTYSGLASGSHTFDVRAKDAAGNVDPTPATYTWTIDQNAPETSFAQMPANPSTTSNATFVFASNESGVVYECKLDGAATFTACSTPHALTGLSDGAHALEVRAKDGVGNVDPTPARYLWTIDTTAPTVSIASGPAAQTTDTTATFDFASNESPITYECELDGSSSFVACGDPATFTGIAVGPHTLTVRARDAAGNVSAAPATHSWTVAPNAPDTTITLAPPAVTASTSATFAFSSTLAGSTFECKLDAALVFSTCTEAPTLLGLADGTHVIEVRARSAVGVVDPTPARHTWIVASPTPPETNIVSGASGVVDSTSAGFVFSSDKGPVTFECRLDGAPTWTACDPAQSYTGLAEGTHTLEVRAKDAAGNVDPTPATTSWIVDTNESPETAIVSGPPAASDSSSATFDLYSPDPSATFECSLDGAPFAPCTDPAVFNNLAEGAHQLSARAKDSDGTVDPTPATYTWTVTPAVVEGDAGGGADADAGAGTEADGGAGPGGGTGGGNADNLDGLRHGGGGCGVARSSASTSGIACVALAWLASGFLLRRRRRLAA
jgi:uncharacterized repeat protein (TIGR01451 family)